MKTVRVTVELLAEEHAAAVSRLTGLQMRQAQVAGGEVPGADTIKLGDYIRTCVRADLIQHSRQMEAEARVKAAQMNGSALRVQA